MAALSRTRGRQSFAARRRLLGDEGERHAYFYLRRQNYVVVARQWRAPNVDGEIDLIAWQGETLCFIEVKTRSANDRFAPERAIHHAKRKALRRMARAYVRSLYASDEPMPAMRIDVVTVLRVARSWRIALHPGAVALQGDD